MTGTPDNLGADVPLVRGPDSTLSAALAELDDGCCVLVTGDAPDDAYRLAASRYFGDPDRRRRRLLALTQDDTDPDAWFPETVDPERDDDAAIVRIDGAVRDPTAVTDQSITDGGPTDTTDAPDRLDLDGSDGADADADAVRTAVLDAVAELDTANDDRLGLRVGFYRADALCAAIGTEPARSVLREIAAETRSRGGMAHIHLPRPASEDPRSDPVVDEFADALGDELDVIVELRSRERAPVPEERWHIRDWGVTEWNRLQ